ncbi:hypothetical protein KSP40_PGU010533 [Platanthera guangdongensis]|uniref:Uncharacterized protein n=1 Tax=Platanthera guangdongensis TaxID=2320717 RepID=A0ABR2MNU5_9ASPA
MGLCFLMRRELAEILNFHGLCPAQLIFNSTSMVIMLSTYVHKEYAVEYGGILISCTLLFDLSVDLASATGSSSNIRSHGHLYRERLDDRRCNDDRGNHGDRKEKRRPPSENNTLYNERKHKRHRYSPKRTPDRSEWDYEKYEWEDTPRRESRDRYSVSHRPQYASPSPMLAGASPDTRLVSPYLGGQTPHAATSPWDVVVPSPVPIRASGRSSRRGSGSRQVERTHEVIEIADYRCRWWTDDHGNTDWRPGWPQNFGRACWKLRSPLQLSGVN